VGVKNLRDVNSLSDELQTCEYITSSKVTQIDLGKGCASVKADLEPSLFFKIIGEVTGLEVADENQLMDNIFELVKVKKRFEKYSDALDEMEATGYGIVMPAMDEMTLAEPEILKQGTKYGIRLKASAPAIHLLKTSVNTEVAPIVGSEKQSEELVLYMLNDFEESPEKIWSSNIFGKSLHELVNEGLHAKMSKLPSDARNRLRETIERMINEGCSGLICFIL
jgi:stage IV sporulation protein A